MASASSSTASAFPDDGHVVITAPTGELWIGAHRIALDEPLIRRAGTRTASLLASPGNAANPIALSSDDDSAPLSQRGSATRNDSGGAFSRAPRVDSTPGDTPGILLGTPIATPLADGDDDIFGGPIPDIYVPKAFLQDTSHLAYAVVDAPLHDIFHVPELRKRKARSKSAKDAAARLRRLAAKEETNFLDMLDKAVRKKAARFDLSAATASLSAAHSATGLVDDPAKPATDPGPLMAVARECGVTDDEAAALAAPPVSGSAP